MTTPREFFTEQIGTSRWLLWMLWLTTWLSIANAVLDLVQR